MRWDDTENLEIIHWDIIDELPVLNVEGWNKDLDRGIGYHVSLRPCAHAEGLHGWALIHSGFEGPESLLAIWWSPGDIYSDGIISPDWVAEIGDSEIDLEEIGLDEEDLREMSAYLREAF